VQLKLRDGSFQTEEQAAVRASGIVDAIAVGNEATAQPANVQKGIPVGAIARQARHVDRQDEPDLAEADPTDEFLEAARLRGGSGAQAEIAIDNVDIGVMPSELSGALPKRVLQAQALLIADDLVGC